MTLELVSKSDGSGGKMKEFSKNEGIKRAVCESQKFLVRVPGGW